MSAGIRRDYYVPHSDEARALMNAYEAEFTDFIKALDALKLKYGATSFLIAHDMHGASLYGFSFDEGKIPSGWRKPDRHGATWPYSSNKAIVEELRARRGPRGSAIFNTLDATPVLAESHIVWPTVAIHSGIVMRPARAEVPPREFPGWERIEEWDAVQRVNAHNAKIDATKGGAE